MTHTATPHDLAEVFISTALSLYLGDAVEIQLSPARGASGGDDGWYAVLTRLGPLGDIRVTGRPLRGVVLDRMLADARLVIYYRSPFGFETRHAFADHGDIGAFMTILAVAYRDLNERRQRAIKDSLESRELSTEEEP